LKTGVVVRQDDIPDILRDDLANEAVIYYQRWKRMGDPYGAWGKSPAKLVEIIDIIEPADALYHPKLEL
jgi:hypothetical protein